MTPIERFIVSVAVAASLLLLGFALRSLWRSRVIAGLRKGERGHARRGHGPTLHYFWSESCAPCKVQELALRELQETLATEGTAVTVARHNALVETELARKMHIVTVPTTLLTADDGRIVAWNPGLIGMRPLLQQVREHLQGT